MSKPTSIRLGDSTAKWVEAKLGKQETFSGYIHNLIREDMSKTVKGKLYRKIDEVICDIEVRLEEIIEEVRSIDDIYSDDIKLAKDEIGELVEFKAELEDAKREILYGDILLGEMTDEDAQELLKDIEEAQLGS